MLRLPSHQQPAQPLGAFAIIYAMLRIALISAADHRLPQSSPSLQKVTLRCFLVMEKKRDAKAKAIPRPILKHTPTSNKHCKAPQSGMEVERLRAFTRCVAGTTIVKQTLMSSVRERERKRERERERETPPFFWNVEKRNVQKHRCLHNSPF